MSKVLVLDSDYDHCQEAVEKVFETFPTDLTGKKVVIKVNALKAGDPSVVAYTTNYNLLDAVLKKVEQLNPAEILIGDSVGTESYGNSEHVFNESKLKESAGKRYSNLNQNLKIVELERPFKRKVAVLKDVIDADFYISLPKMKSHGLTRITGAIKNNYGLLTGAQKSWYHYYSVYPEVFAEIIIEMFKLRQPDLVIMDAIMAMEGYGPASTETRWVNKILASDEAVALETVQAHMIGFDVEEIPVLSLARKQNLGETVYENIEVIGEAPRIEEWHRPDPPHASYSYRAGVGSGSTSIEYYRSRVALLPVFNAEKCSKECSICVDYCPFGALSMKDNVPVVDPEKCNQCSSCKERCPHGAVDLQPDPVLMKKLEEEEKSRELI